MKIFEFAISRLRAYSTRSTQALLDREEVMELTAFGKPIGYMISVDKFSEIMEQITETQPIPVEVSPDA